MTNLKEADSVLADLVSEYVDQLNAGRKVTPEKFIAAHPAFAEQLRSLLQAVSFVNDSAAALRVQPARAQVFDSVITRLHSEINQTASTPKPQQSADATVDQRQDCMILLLHFMKSIWNTGVWGNTKLVKMLLLLEKEADCSQLVPNFYPHYAYNFGAFDEDVPKDADALAAHGVITKKTPPRSSVRQGQLGIPNQKRVEAVFELTDKGEKVALALLEAAKKKNPAIVKKIEAVVKTHGNKNSGQLIAYTYRKYPELAEKSLIRDKYIKPEDK